MRTKISQFGSKGGFALVAVLSSLTILLLLFVISSRLTLASQSFYATEKHILQARHNAAGTMSVLASLSREDVQKIVASRAPISKSEDAISLQDVNGLIDLNTASPEILGALIGQLGGNLDALPDYLDWRRRGHRLYRINDVMPFFEIPSANTAQLESIGTLYSGRRDVDFERAPTQVLEVIQLGRAVPEQSDRRPSENLAIYKVDSESGRQKLLGIINYGGAGVLALQ